ncbi:hypothetical protein Tco_0438613 [Tanacetum coccineum]
MYLDLFHTRVEAIYLRNLEKKVEAMPKSAWQRKISVTSSERKKVNYVLRKDCWWEIGEGDLTAAKKSIWFYHMIFYTLAGNPVKEILLKLNLPNHMSILTDSRILKDGGEETDEHEEVEVDDTDELKRYLVIKKDDDIAIDVIPLATKPLVIVDYKLLKEGIMGIDREDLQTLWKLIKKKHGDLRPEDEHERVLWGDLKVMFEPDIRSDV